MNQVHTFHDPSFSQHFQKQVFASSWRCNFPRDILLDSFSLESKLFKDKSKFTQRRHRATLWLDDDQKWEKVILGACDELAGKQNGQYCKILSSLHVLEAYTDFVEHLNCFYSIAATMSLQGQLVKPVSQYQSQVHDIDKLDPVMLVGYSEKFEDNVNSSVWELCVERHVSVNPHHQGHEMWHSGHEDASTLNSRADAMNEMVCDKVSRRLQKNLGGVMCEDMWSVDPVFFQGLPERWMDKANGIIQLMKLNSVTF